jgi:hypothetical protein
LSGARAVSDLPQVPRVITGMTRAWIDQLGYERPPQDWDRLLKRADQAGPTSDEPDRDESRTGRVS